MDSRTAPAVTPAALDRVGGHYAEAIQQFGPTSRAVGWRDDASQRLRFDRLFSVVESTDSTVTVNDLGCGYGAMFGYLDERLGAQLQRYYGYDISQLMLDAAAPIVETGRAELILSREPTETADYTFISGTYNVRMDASEDEWTAYVRQSLLTAAARSRRGLAFNLLTTHVDWREPHLFYANPIEFFEFCRTNISHRVALLHDYPLFEWTLLVRKV